MSGLDPRHVERQVARRVSRRPLPWPVMLGIGWTIAGCTLFGVWAGRQADAWQPEPWSWTLCGLTAGLMAGCAVAWAAVRARLENGERHAHKH